MKIRLWLKLFIQAHWSHSVSH